jgi:hypothetical protein
MAAIEPREETDAFFLRVDTDARGFFLWRVHSPDGDMVVAAPAGTPTLVGAINEAKRAAEAMGLPSLRFDP